MIDHSAGDSERAARLAAAGLAKPERDINDEKGVGRGRRTNLHSDQLKLHQLHLQGLLLSLQLSITNSRVGMRNSGHQATGKVTLLLSEPVATTIDCGCVGGLIHPLLWIDVHVMGEHVGQLIFFLAERLLVVGGRGETGWDVKRDTSSSTVRSAGHGVGANAAGTKTSKEGSAMARSWGGGHSEPRKWAEGSSGR
jgi:hypothetical protein